MAVGYRDYYADLGVSRDASNEEIRRAYRKLARENHPDVNKDSGAEDRFKEISEAYEVLRDPEKRKAYDRFGANWKQGQDVSGAEGFRDGGGYRDAGFDFGGDADFSSFFEGLFRGRGAGRGRGGFEGFEGFSMRGADQEAVLELSLEEAARGGRQRLSLGRGQEIDVDIPAGVRDGQRIRLAGQGGAGPGDGPPGDLFLRVRIRPHPLFDIDGRDLYVDLPVTPWEAALGAEVPVPTLDGEATVRVPPGSSTGRKLRLRGQGLPGRGTEAAGDLYAEVEVHVPRDPTPKERELFERLRDVSEFNPRSGR
jgi:curved DNA-binding protein